MDANQIRIVQATWREIAPNATGAALLFYARLFEIDPSLRRLFPADLTPQAGKLMQTLGVAVASLERLEQITPTVELLGRRHVDYGVLDSDYDTVGQALLDVLASALGDAFTVEVRAAWAETYAILANVMRRAASEHLAERRATAVRAAMVASHEAYRAIGGDETVIAAHA
jgi:hemoglobin-like flavoprotein